MCRIKLRAWPTAPDGWSPARPLAAGMADGVVFDLLENPVEADDKVEAVHDETDADETDECDLIVAEPAPDAGRPVDAW